MLPALLAHNHEVVAYVRSTSTLSPEISSKINSIVEGSGTDSAAIKAAILSQNCDAVVNAAGLAPLTSFGKKGQLPEIFAAIVKAAVEARQERGGPPLRCWFLSGWDILDSPKQPHLIYDYVPLYPDHKKTYNLIKSYTPDNIACLYSAPVICHQDIQIRSSLSPVTFQAIISSRKQTRHQHGRTVFAAGR